MVRERGWLTVTVILASMLGGAVSSLFLTARLGAQGADVVTASQTTSSTAKGACGPCWPPRTNGG